MQLSKLNGCIFNYLSVPPCEFNHIENSTWSNKTKRETAYTSSWPILSLILTNATVFALAARLNQSYWAVLYQNVHKYWIRSESLPWYEPCFSTYGVCWALFLPQPQNFEELLAGAGDQSGMCVPLHHQDRGLRHCRCGYVCNICEHFVMHANWLVRLQNCNCSRISKSNSPSRTGTADLIKEHGQNNIVMKKPRFGRITDSIWHDSAWIRTVVVGVFLLLPCIAQPMHHIWSLSGRLSHVQEGCSKKVTKAIYVIERGHWFQIWP